MSAPAATFGDMLSRVHYQAAWVPGNDPERPWDAAAALCVQWVIAESKAQATDPLLVTPTQSQWSSGAESVVWMAQQYEAATPLSNRAAFSKRPVLAYVPDYQTMEIAGAYARESSLAVVESVSTPLVGWAMEVRAVSLLTGEATPDTRTESQRKDLESLSFNGHNGWGDDYGKRTARRILSGMRERGDLDPSLILGYMVARGHGHRGVKRLATLIGKIQ